MYVFMTDFGEITPGPKFQMLLDSLSRGLTMSKRTKEYKRCKAELDKIEDAANVIALADWMAGEVPKETP